MIYGFLEFKLDVERMELWRGSAKRAVEPQVFSLLVYLIENRDRVVSKDELFDAVWEGRIVSDATLNTRINAARKAVDDTGKEQAVILTMPRRGFRFVADIDGGSARIDPPDISQRQKGSIAVLPFVNISGDPEQEYFADGITEDIITALSNVRTLTVLARSSTFVYKGKSVDVRQVKRELDVHYLIEGSVRRASERIRVTAQLINTATGDHLWAERYDGTLDDIFDLQDQITSKIIGTIEPELVRAEDKRLQASPPDNINAYDLLLRGVSYMHKVTPEDTKTALEYFAKAYELDPNYGRAYAFASWCYRRDAMQRGNALLSAEDCCKAIELARQALRCDRNDPYVLVYAGCSFYQFDGAIDEGLSLIDQALSMNPNSHRFWNAKAQGHSYKGETDAAIEAAQRAISISPNEPAIWVAYWALAEAHLQELSYQQAADFAQRALRRNSNVGPAYFILAAASAHLGQASEAKQALAAGLQISPGLTLTKLPEYYQVSSLKNLDAYRDGLRKAGLPE